MSNLARILLIGTIAATLATALFLLRAGGIDIALPATTPAIAVFLAAAGAAGCLLLLAAKLRIVEIARSIAPSSRPADQIIDELVDLTGIAGSEGLLAVAADPHAKTYPLLRSAVLLLARDADDKLLRSSLESQAETALRRTGNRRAFAATACRVGVATLATGAAAAAVVLGAFASSVASLGALPAAALLAACIGFFVWHSLAAPIASRLYALNASDSFIARASIQAALAMHNVESAPEAAARLRRLLPPVGSEVPQLKSTRAAA